MRGRIADLWVRYVICTGTYQGLRSIAWVVWHSTRRKKDLNRT